MKAGPVIPGTKAYAGARPTQSAEPRKPAAPKDPAPSAKSAAMAPAEAWNVTRVNLTREFPVPPEVVWRYLTDPEGMNAWSEAPVALVRRGEDGRVDGDGAVRRTRVSAWGVSGTIEERVEESRPPERFVYRVTEGMGIRGHRGEIVLEKTPIGTRVRWDIEFGGAVPGWSLLFKALMVPAFERSLDELQRLLARGAGR